MSTGSHKNASSNATQEMGPILIGFLALFCFLAAFPAWLIGFLAQRYLERTLFSWKARLLIWLVLGLFAGYYLYSHSVLDLMLREEHDYLAAARSFQYDFPHWPWKTLWADTWPVWTHTLVAIPVAGLAHELASRAPAGQTARQLLQQQRRRERADAHAQNTARKRSSKPGAVPDEVGGQMVIGIPIQDDHG